MVAGPGTMRDAMTDGLVEVIGVSCKLLLSDDVCLGRVSSNGSIPGHITAECYVNEDCLQNVEFYVAL